jgi:predicted transcriptional regulator
MDRNYTPYQLAEIMNIDPELVKYYLQRSATPTIKKDVSFFRYDRKFYDKVISELSEGR